jgi:hypothetical protein
LQRIERDFLGEIHCMFRLPIANYRLSTGCPFAIAHSLTGVISGVSTTLYAHGGESGKRFKGVLIEYYPFDLEPSHGASANDCADIIYSLYRNPLAHNFGLHTAKGVLPPAVKIKKIHSIKGRRGLTEQQIERLERSSPRPSLASAVTVRSDATVLGLEALYWGVRVMIERLLKDRLRMSKANSYLAPLRP